jgi:phosphatidylglycerophosphatase A
VSFARVVATLGPIGSSPIVPATVASFVVAVIGWFLPVPPLAITLVLLAAGTAIAVWASGEAEKTLGHDAKPIVVDELIGQSIAMLFIPHLPVAFAVSFLLFRLFDVWKPLGAHALQRLPGGIGVVADDFAAGIMACGAFHLGAWLIRLIPPSSG